MSLRRRDLAVLGAAAAAGLTAGGAESRAGGEGGYGIVSQILAVSGRRDELAAILLAGSRDMPGCRLYFVAADLANPDALWITEAWDSRESHAHAVGSPQVQAAIAKGRPLIAGFASHAETKPLGGSMGGR